jgi:hypothetical protein
MSKVSITTNVSPATVNRLRMNLYKASSPLAVIDTLEQDWQAENLWTFYNLLPSVNYIYNLYEVDGSGIQLQQYTNSPNFTALSAGSIQVKPPVDVEVGVTPGVLNGNNSATFSDWVGWDITAEEVGSGTMQRGTAYSYDPTTAVFTLLGQGHVFIQGQRFFIRFEPKVVASSGAISKDLWEDVLFVNTDTVLQVGDMGKKIIIQGSGTYLSLTLPDVNAIPKNRMLYIESDKGNHVNATIISSNPSAIDWMEGNRTKLYIGTNEKIDLYGIVQSGASKWRVHNADGNFKTVGRTFYSYEETPDNAIELNGPNLDSKEYSRLYDYVLGLDTSLIVPYDQWFTGNNGTNKFKFSYVDARGFFRVPDLRGYYTINAGGLSGDALIKPGDFLAQSMIDLRVHTVSDIATGDKKPTKTTSIATSSASANGNQDYDLCKTSSIPSTGISGPPVDINGDPISVGRKLRPDSIAARLFINT